MVRPNGADWGCTVKTIKKGFGYWDTTIYPYGGAFHRSNGTICGEVSRVVSTYNDGSPREYELKNGKSTYVVKAEGTIDGAPVVESAGAK